MSVLFDTLAARFRSDIQPAIRPRPQARFEGRYDNTGLREEATEYVVPALSGAPAPTLTGSARSEQSARSAGKQLEPAIPASSAKEPLRTPRPSDRSAVPDAPRSPETVHPQVENVAPEELVRAPTDNKVRPEQRQPIKANSPGTTKRWTSERQDDEPASIVERITETIIHTEVPQTSVHQTETPAAAPFADARSDTSQIRESPVIRIGRIEVTQPAPPAPPPPKPVPARPEPQRRPTPLTHGKQTSRLTDYLGWKK